MIRLILLLTLVTYSFSLAKADEGMWLPMLLKQLGIEDRMHDKGLKINAEDVYSINQACLKDAVVIFGGGCTGEIISDQGLLLTNHHCGLGQIQRHSSVENDYLKDGFWAMSKEEELPNPELSVIFLRSMEDVTDKVLNGASKTMSYDKKQKLIEKNIAGLVKLYEKKTGYIASVKSFFNDNSYYLLLQEKFSDIRLVGAPPSAIGKFGGDTDNWVWPRHGGDFALFRIYADSNNKASEYNLENKPYAPKTHLPISLKGIKEGDFTMVMGYPGSTNEYATSFHLRMLSEQIYPKLIDIRTKKLDIIGKAMEDSAQKRIQYTSKAARISNSWKRWKGELRGMKKLDAIAKKEAFEEGFQSWSNEQAPEYKEILSKYETVYSKYSEYYLAYSIYREMFSYGLELSSYYGKLLSQLEDQKENINSEQAEELVKAQDLFYKDFDQETGMLLDRELLDMLLHLLPKSLNSFNYKAEELDDLIHAQYQEDQNAARIDFSKYIGKKQQLITDLKITAQSRLKLYNSLYTNYKDHVVPNYTQLKGDIKLLDQQYMKGILAYKAGESIYPDANFTLRVAYGNVAGYEARDGVLFNHQTYLKGIIEKDNPEIYDYKVPQRLKELYYAKDFGDYAAPNGDIPVCFIANNHTTGGNSGSPVFNENGELIGLNFDRAWEGVTSDLIYNPKQSRNISVDIRYILFIVDKYAGAKHIIKELDIRK